MTTPDHVENTGDNLRHAAEIQKQAREHGDEDQLPPEQAAPAGPLPDFNT